MKENGILALKEAERKRGGRKAGNILVSTHYIVTMSSQSGTSWHEYSLIPPSMIVCVGRLNNFVLVKPGHGSISFGKIGRAWVWIHIKPRITLT